MPVQATQFKSDFESKITYNFIKAGLESNRIVALYKAIGVIAISSILIVTHTTTGVLKSVVFLSQGDLESATTEIIKGLSKSTHSLVTIFQVSMVALYGLAVGAAAYKMMDLKSEDKTPPPVKQQMEELTPAANEIQRLLEPIIQQLQTKLTTMQTELETQKNAYAQLKKAHESEADEFKKDCLAFVAELEKEIATKNEQIEHLTKTFEKHLQLYMSRASQGRLEGNAQPAVSYQYSQESPDSDMDLEAFLKLTESSEIKEEEPLFPAEISSMRTPTKGNLDPRSKIESPDQKKTTNHAPFKFNLENKENVLTNSLGGHHAVISN
ncbi:MAG: hypothetical protein KBA81_03495 [Rhabdochlamydiaceae bacterium]|nr:hypothetical protein [Rhabdochlamydiaceae bacterium]